jgi:NADH dehydrogenase [ubiquinone] 1 alpha subcomplex assembly factor 7
MSYDPDARRDTPLALKLKERIRREGPITVAEYMRACLHDPQYGYYTRMPAIGAAGDFVTAPEISQVFGELIGLWCAVVWQQMGSPEVVHLVELGPGRGTMMRDALRAARVMPGFLKAVRVHLVESNAALREVQARMLEGRSPVWHGRLGSIGKAPTIIVANEFLDTCAVDHFEVAADGIRERGVGLDESGRLVFRATGKVIDAPEPAVVRALSKLQPGDIVERPDFGFLELLNIEDEDPPAAALFIDYGHTVSQLGETLQAVRDHQAEHPLTSPGEADLSVQVDFDLFGAAAQSGGFAIDGPVTQAEFLGSLGIVERASRLMAANPARAGEIEAGVARLIAPNAMGSRFKAIGLRSAGLPPLPGFPVRSAI